MGRCNVVVSYCECDLGVNDVVCVDADTPGA